jgi:hypothetical protein
MKRILGMISIIAGIYFLFFYSKSISAGNYLKYIITYDNNSFTPLYEEIIRIDKYKIDKYTIRFDNITNKGEIKSSSLKINSQIDTIFPAEHRVKTGIVDYKNIKFKCVIYDFNTNYKSSYVVYDAGLNIPVFGESLEKDLSGEHNYKLDLETNMPLTEVSYFKYYLGIPLLIFGALSLITGFVIER